MLELQTLMTGLVIGESPRWHEGRLWFSNWGAQEIIAVDVGGNSEVVTRVPTTIPFSIDWLPDGRLLVVSGQEGLLLRREADGSLVTHADLSGLSNKPWNEIVVDGRGHIYVTSAQRNSVPESSPWSLQTARFGRSPTKSRSPTAWS
jgi:sugar lactone lactonase YvrE